MKKYIIIKIIRRRILIDGKESWKDYINYLIITMIIMIIVIMTISLIKNKLNIKSLMIKFIEFKEKVRSTEVTEWPVGGQ